MSEIVLFVIGLALGLAGGFAGNFAEMWHTSRVVKRERPLIVADVKREIISCLGSEEMQPAIDGLMSRIKASPVANDMANSLGQGIVQGASDAVFSGLTGALGGVQKDVNMVVKGAGPGGLDVPAALVNKVGAVKIGKTGLTLGDVAPFFMSKQTNATVSTGGGGWG